MASPRTQIGGAKIVFSLIAAFLVMRAAPGALAATEQASSIGQRLESKLELESSDAHLVEGFNWAKKQAMAYVFDDDL